jgi:hypothetical protein
MSHVIFNNSGTPLIGYGSKALFITSGISATAASKDSVGTITVKPLDFAPAVDKYQIAQWGTSNKFPQDAEELISKVGVLNTGLRFIRNVMLGQGIYPCKIKGYDDKGNEQLEIIENTELRNFLNSRMIRRYMEKATRDFLKYGTAFPEFVPSADSKKLVGINCINALHSRFTVANSMGEIENCIVSGRWPNMPADESEFKIIPVLSEYDPEQDLERRRLDRTFGKGTIIYPLRDSWSNKDYYSAPAWWPTKEAGWLDIALLIPKFLKKAYENQISWKWHVKIPYAFWDKKFPETEYATKDLRKTAIENYLDSIETNLCSPENANKAIFTFFEIGPGGKAEEEWKIEALDNKYKDGENLITSAAANSEILFSLMINPNVLGAGMPGGTYAGNQGGSNIREAFLINIANTWPERQNLLDPIECFLRFNGIHDIELRFRNTVLTTLDTGAGTTKTLS